MCFTNESFSPFTPQALFALVAHDSVVTKPLTKKLLRIHFIMLALIKHSLYLSLALTIVNICHYTNFFSSASPQAFYSSFN